MEPIPTAVKYLLLFYGLVFVLAIIGGILAFVFWIFMIIDCAKRKFDNENERIAWILIVVLAGVIGAVIYYFVVKRKGKARGNAKEKKGKTK